MDRGDDWSHRMDYDTRSRNKDSSCSRTSDTGRVRYRRHEHINVYSRQFVLVVHRFT